MKADKDMQYLRAAMQAVRGEIKTLEETRALRSMSQKHERRTGYPLINGTAYGKS